MTQLPKPTPFAAAEKPKENKKEKSESESEPSEDDSDEDKFKDQAAFKFDSNANASLSAFPVFETTKVAPAKNESVVPAFIPETPKFEVPDTTFAWDPKKFVADDVAFSIGTTQTTPVPEAAPQTALPVPAPEPKQTLAPVSSFPKSDWALPAGINLMKAPSATSGVFLFGAGGDSNPPAPVPNTPALSAAATTSATQPFVPFSFGAVASLTPTPSAYTFAPTSTQIPMATAGAGLTPTTANTLGGFNANTLAPTTATTLGGFNFGGQPLDFGGFGTTTPALGSIPTFSSTPATFNADTFSFGTDASSSAPSGNGAVPQRRKVVGKRTGGLPK